MEASPVIFMLFRGMISALKALMVAPVPRGFLNHHSISICASVASADASTTIFFGEAVPWQRRAADP